MVAGGGASELGQDSPVGQGTGHGRCNAVPLTWLATRRYGKVVPTCLAGVCDSAPIRSLESHLGKAPELTRVQSLPLLRP